MSGLDSMSHGTLSRENFAASVPNPPTSLQVSQKTSPELELRGFLSIVRDKAWSHIVIFLLFAPSYVQSTSSLEKSTC